MMTYFLALVLALTELVLLDLLKNMIQESNSKSSNLSITYSGILSKTFKNNFFLSSGMGIALLSDDKIGERNLGTSLQFESRFEFGYKPTNTSSSLNIFHYSNAGAANDNSGVNILMINLSLLF